MTNEVDYDDVKHRAEKRMAVIDHLPAATKEIIHEFGWARVKVLMDAGIKSPPQIKHIIRIIINGGNHGWHDPK